MATLTFVDSTSSFGDEEDFAAGHVHGAAVGGWFHGSRRGSIRQAGDRVAALGARLTDLAGEFDSVSSVTWGRGLWPVLVAPWPSEGSTMAQNVVRCFLCHNPDLFS